MEPSNSFADNGASVDQNVAHPGIRLRTYQAEMLEASLQGNIIVVQDTGSGKTHMFVSSFCF
jgi:superfamily II DNA or RNA helicase